MSDFKEFLFSAEISPLDDQAALEAAWDYHTFSVEYAKTSTINALFANYELKIPFKKAALDPLHPFQHYADALIDSMAQPTDWNMLAGTPIGDGNLAMLNEMINGNDQGVVFEVDGKQYSTELSQIRDMLAYEAGVVNYPFKSKILADVKILRGVKESLDLGNITTTRTLALSIATSAPKPMNVKIEQRYGSDVNDLTEWHPLTEFIGVYYKQRTYKCSINAVPQPATIRELRVVSDVTLGMSVI